MYEKWCELEREKYSAYNDYDTVIEPIEKQKEFKTIKNAIIKAVLDISDSPRVSVRTRASETAEFEPERSENILRSSVRMEVDEGTNDFEVNSDDLDFGEDESDINHKSFKIRTSAHIPPQNHKEPQNYTPSAANAALSLIKSLGRMISDDYVSKWGGQNFGVDHKLKRVIDRQKEALGIQIDRSMEQKF